MLIAIASVLLDDAHLPQGVAIDPHLAVIAWVDSDFDDDPAFGPIRHQLVVVDVDGIGWALVAFYLLMGIAVPRHAAARAAAWARRGLRRRI